MAFDKSKALATAEKYVAQGKIPAAVQEYLGILKKDPKDLNLLNTVGDLYVRAGQVPEALKHYYKLGDSYVADGFLMRGIAIYKKIIKLDPNPIQALEKLAELYVLQGLLSDARSQYLQLAETYLKGNQADAAAGIFHKMLELEPDNITVQNRLADLYQRLGKKGEAVSIYLGAAERLIQRDDYLEAAKLIDKALATNAKNVTGQMLKARCELQLGQAEEALRRLQAIPNYEEEGPVVDVLLEAFMAMDRFDDARSLASHVLAAHPERYNGVFAIAVHQVERGEHEGALELLAGIAATMVAQREVERLASVVREIATALPTNPAPLELLVDINRRAGDMSYLARSLDRLGKCYVDLGQYETARPLYEELTRVEPENPEHGGHLAKVLEKLGIKPERVREAVPLKAPDKEPVGLARGEVAAAPGVIAGEIALDEETQTFVTSSLTDADLFSSYGAPQKAIDLLAKVVQRVPQHAGAFEKLLDLYVGQGSDAKIVEVATRLEEIYRSRGDQARADKFSEMATRYTQAAAAAGAPVRAPGTHEVDLSAEWETTAMEAPPAAEVNWQDVREEIGFYLNQNMFQEAQQVIARLEAQHAGRPELIELRDQLASAEAAASFAAAPEAVAVEAGEATTAFEFGAEEMPAAEIPVEASAEAAPAAFEMTSAGETQEFTFAAVEEPPAAEAPVAEEAPEAPAVEAAGETYEVTLEEVPAAEPDRPGGQAPAPAAAGASFLDELAGELDTTFAGLEAAATPPVAAQPSASRAAAGPAAAASAAELGGLSELFQEFKDELGEAEGAEDPETHYNLGIAYREMGLVDEAISEFQKVVKAAESQPFRSIFQCFTLLALCFMERGMPKIAVRWYDRALRSSGLDPEGALALRYDMGVAYETAGEKQAALDSFSEVYSSNIDYRDVADRIRTLQKELR